jgi:hypothetical protein
MTSQNVIDRYYAKRGLSENGPGRRKEETERKK